MLPASLLVHQLMMVSTGGLIRQTMKYIKELNTNRSDIYEQCKYLFYL